MNQFKEYKHWKIEQDQNFLWVYFDKHNSSINTLDKEVMEEFSHIIDAVSQQKNVSRMILASKKKSGFIAGADISQFTKFPSIEEAEQMLKLGQYIFSKLENLTIPTVAIIDGFCLGGGLELVLACRYRIAEDSPKTRIGFPEVKLGIIPGWGGTVRTPRLIGPVNALNLILNGHTISGKAAAKIGLVDAVVPRRQLQSAAKYYVSEKPPVHQPTFGESILNKKFFRQFLAAYIRRKMAKKIKEIHYPAPFRALDNWEMLGGQGQASYDREAKVCAQLFFSDTCQNLVRVFFLQEKLKGLAKDSLFDVKHVHVIGAGTMGGDIAAWCALRGLTVTLQDLEAKFIVKAIKRANALFNEKLKEKYLVQAAMDRLIPDVNGYGLGKADIIIEAVVEDLSIKQNLFRMIETAARPDAILATNTSSIPLDEINTVLQRPDRLVGIHFFNPVAKMQLVEVVQGNKTQRIVIEKVINFVRKIDRLPLPVKSSPGFLVNRILMPYLLESVNLLNEGVPAEVIDKAMTDFGMPMGPITLADTVGLDVCLSVAKYLSQYFHSPIPPALVKKVENRQLGRKTGEGFFKYDAQGKRVKGETSNVGTSPISTAQITDRLVLRMLNEAFACLREGVVADGDLLDAGMIFGTGFAPFRGGPIHYAKSQGIHALYQQFVLQQRSRGESVDDTESWENEAAN